LAVALIVFSRESGLTDADRAAIEDLGEWLDGPDRPESVQAYVTVARQPSLAPMFRSEDGTVDLRLDLNEPSFLPAANEAIDSVRAHLAAPGVLPAGLSAQLSGQAGIGRDYLAAIQEGTDRTTLATIILVVVILLLIYRAPLAAMVPLATIGCAFLVSRGLLGFVAEAGWKLSSVLDSFIVVLAFGVGTDYAIFLVSRFREELGRHSHDDAVRVTVGRIAVYRRIGRDRRRGRLMVAASFGMIQTTGPALALYPHHAGGRPTLTLSLLAIFGRRLFGRPETKGRGPDDHGFWPAGAPHHRPPGPVAAVRWLPWRCPAGHAGSDSEPNWIEELPVTAESRRIREAGRSPGEAVDAAERRPRRPEPTEPGLADPAGRAAGATAAAPGVRR
jgi:RND superfamily putative drug exporter